MGYICDLDKQTATSSNGDELCCYLRCPGVVQGPKLRRGGTDLGSSAENSNQGLQRLLSLEIWMNRPTWAWTRTLNQIKPLGWRGDGFLSNPIPCRTWERSDSFGWGWLTPRTADMYHGDEDNPKHAITNCEWWDKLRRLCL